MSRLSFLASAFNLACIAVSLAFGISLVSLTGCATTGADDDSVSIIQQAAVNLCHYLPTAETVAELLKVDADDLSTGSGIAHAICDAVTSDASTTGVATLFKLPPTVHGVLIRGKHVG